MSREHPPLLLRLAVVVGGFTLLLGLVGVVLIVLRGDDVASAAGPGLGEHVRVVGAEEGAQLTVSARWEEGPILHNEAARPLASESHVFLLPPGLAGRTVVLVVHDAETSRSLATREVRLQRGEEIRVEVEPVGER